MALAVLIFSEGFGLGKYLHRAGGLLKDSEAGGESMGHGQGHGHPDFANIEKRKEAEIDNLLLLVVVPPSRFF